MKKFRNIAIALLIFFTAIVLFLGLYYNINMAKVSEDSTLKEITIEEGSIDSIANTLKENNLIKNITIFKVYLRLTNKTNLKAGIYNFSENMGVKKIVTLLEKGSNINPDEITITFKEGINIRTVAKLIANNTDNTFDDIINKIKDTSYINSLIDEYWFLTEDIKNENIYYPLEGYLYPNTYRFNSREVSIEDVFKKMLDETDRKLSKYRNALEGDNLSIHQLITLASIVELEGAKADDRKAVAGVFYNRLNSTSYPTLGSDATTYYASKIDDWSYSLTSKELNDCTNMYNTRCSSNTGLPIGPICNPSIESIEATINPESHEYYFFVADCQGKVYLTKNSIEHEEIIDKLRKDNNWCA